MCPLQPAPGARGPPEERRPLAFSLPGPGYGLAGPGYGLADLRDVAKGRLSLVEALRALHCHKTQPAAWTVERLALEYCLDPEDARNLLYYFIPFNVQILPPASGGHKQMKGS